MKRVINLRKRAFIFVILFLSPLLFVTNLLINGQVLRNHAENRVTSTFNYLLEYDFMSQQFQQNLESALLDQFPGSENLKVEYKKAVAKVENAFRKNVLNISCATERYEVRDGIYNLFCDDYLVWSSSSKERMERISTSFVEMLNNHKIDAEMYAYFINDSKTFDDHEKKENKEIYNTFKQSLSSYDVSTDELEINSLEDFKHYFYKTDHHWNLYGSYQGYQDVIELLLGNEELIKPIRQVNFNLNYCGSFCRMIGYYDYTDLFSIYEFKYPELEIFINGESGKYGLEKEYIEAWQLEKNSNFYGGVYGGNYGELTMHNKNGEGKENLLVFATSFINPINKLIANHFNSVYVIDLRHYENDFGKKFDIENYIEEHSIDKVLFLGDLDFYSEFPKLMEGE